MSHKDNEGEDKKCKQAEGNAPAVCQNNRASKRLERIQAIQEDEGERMVLEITV